MARCCCCVHRGRPSHSSLKQDRADEDEGWKQFQFRWYLRCYGYDKETEFAAALAPRRTILDAGCGPGYKAAWLAQLNPAALVVAMDLSDSIFVARERYAALPNLMFVKGDIADTPFIRTTDAAWQDAERT